MDYISLSEALRCVVRTIEEVAIPSTPDQFARSQLWASTGVLGNIANELDDVALPVQAPTVGHDFDALLRAVGQLDPFASADAAGAAAKGVREDLDTVIATHATLHYRRAVAGFE